MGRGRWRKQAFPSASVSEMYLAPGQEVTPGEGHPSGERYGGEAREETGPLVRAGACR